VIYKFFQIQEENEILPRGYVSCSFEYFTTKRPSSSDIITIGYFLFLIWLNDISSLPQFMQTWMVNL